MFENLQKSLENVSTWGEGNMQELGWWPLVVALLISALAAFFVSLLYVHFYSSRSTGSHVHQAFPLLGIAITAVFVCIQFSLPLSLGLLGALSIVRFRTPIKEPEEIGFIMVVIACSLACATLNFRFLTILLLIVVTALVVKRYTRTLFDAASNDGSIIVSVPASAYTEKGDEILQIVESSPLKTKIESISKGTDEVVLSLLFRGSSPRGLVELERRFSAVAPPSNFTVVYSRPGKL